MKLDQFVSSVNAALAQVPKINRPIAPGHPKVVHEDDIFGHFPLLVWTMSNLRKTLVRTGTWCEFGVYKGESLGYIASFRGDAKLYGLDSFQGLPEDWFPGAPKGTFVTDVPSIQGAELVIGHYADTLQTFDPIGPVTFCHVDCDLYSSSKLVLEWLRPRVTSGSVVLFDELLTPPHENGEMRALCETWQDVSYEWLASGQAQAVLRVL